MIDYVRQALGRILGIKQHHIGRWDLSAIGSSAGLIGGYAPAKLQAEMSLMLHWDAYPFLRDISYGGKRGSVLVQSLTVNDRFGEGREVQAKVVLLYGKETQHFFKALAQAFTVRGRPPKKKSTRSKGTK